MKKLYFNLGIVALAALLLTPVGAMAAVPADLSGNTAGSVATFRDAFLAVYNNTLLGLLGAEYADLVAKLHPDAADINGESSIDDRGSDLVFELGGNGMLDASTELKLLEEALKNTAYNVNGMTHQIAADAYAQNNAQFTTDVGMYWGLLASLANGLPQILKGYMCLGDGEADYSVDDYVSCNGSAGFIAAVMFLLGDNITNPVINLDNYGRLPEAFGMEGDLDGDGCTNHEEFVTAGGNLNAVIYVAYAKDPALGCQASEGEGEGEGEGEPFIHGNTWVEEGETLTLTVLGAKEPASYSWRQNGGVVGSAKTYTVASVTPANAGAYTCIVSDSSKRLFNLGPVQVIVVAPGGLPVAALGGLVAAALACVSAGAMVIRRKK